MFLLIQMFNLNTQKIGTFRKDSNSPYDYLWNKAPENYRFS
jgi:hypothetical protein